jgi:hypothetical protein
LEYLLKRETWSKENYQVKPSLDVLKKLLEVVNCLEFPEGVFKSNLKEAVEQTEAIRLEFNNMNEKCNWGHLQERKGRKQLSEA